MWNVAKRCIFLPIVVILSLLWETCKHGVYVDPSLPSQYTRALHKIVFSWHATTCFLLAPPLSLQGVWGYSRPLFCFSSSVSRVWLRIDLFDRLHSIYRFFFCEISTIGYEISSFYSDSHGGTQRREGPRAAEGAGARGARDRRGRYEKRRPRGGVAMGKVACWKSDSGGRWETAASRWWRRIACWKIGTSLFLAQATPTLNVEG